MPASPAATSVVEEAICTGLAPALFDKQRLKPLVIKAAMGGALEGIKRFYLCRSK